MATKPPTRNKPPTRGASPAPPSAEESRHQKDSVQVGAVKEFCAGFCVLDRVSSLRGFSMDLS
ncbi:MAG: hypothetical protein ACK58T_41645, partial [Phycisphaerae bacterium]